MSDDEREACGVEMVAAFVTEDGALAQTMPVNGMDEPAAVDAGRASRQRAKRGKGSLFKRGNVWWYAVSYRGRAIRESTEETDKKKAQGKLNAKLDELAGARAGHGRVITPDVKAVKVKALLDALLVDYELRGVKSLPQVRAHLGYPAKKNAEAVSTKIVGAFGHWRVVDLVDGDAAIERYIRDRIAHGASPATVNRETQLFAQALTPFFAKKLRQPMPTIRRFSEKGNARKGFFERADFEAVLAQITDRAVADFLSWFYWTGMRPKEIGSLTWADYDAETSTLRLHARDAKTGYGRVIPLENELRAIIDRRIKARRFACPFMFHRAGEPMGDFRKTWLSACRAAGFTVTVDRDGQTIERAAKLRYDLRRTAVRNMVRAGVDPAVAMKISGHRTRAVFDRYNIIDESDVRDAVRKTSQYVNALPTERTVVPLAAARTAKHADV